MEDCSIERAGIANLDFTGDLIGKSSETIPTVKIFRTKGLKYVGVLGANQKLAQAENFDTPLLLINWFKSICGRVTPQVQDAIEDATKNDAAFKAAWNDHVD
jgi:hypothetical protein